MFCAKCGNQLSDNAQFCEKCGAQVGAAAPASQPMTAVSDDFTSAGALFYLDAQKKANNSIVWFVIGLVLFIIAFILGLGLSLVVGALATNSGIFINAIILFIMYFPSLLCFFMGLMKDLTAMKLAKKSEKHIKLNKAKVWLIINAVFMGGAIIAVIISILINASIAQSSLGLQF